MLGSVRWRSAPGGREAKNLASSSQRASRVATVRPSDPAPWGTGLGFGCSAGPRYLITSTREFWRSFSGSPNHGGGVLENLTEPGSRSIQRYMSASTGKASRAAASNRNLILETGKIGLALLQERAQRLFRFGRAQTLGEDPRFFVYRSGERFGVACLHQALGKTNGFGRQGGERACNFKRMIEQLFLRNHLRDDPRLIRLLRGEGQAEQQKPGSALVPRDQRQQQGRAELGHDTERNERKLETRIRRGINEIAVQQHRGADADRWSADRRDHGLLHARQRLEQGTRGRSAGRARSVEEIGDVVAGGEAVRAAVQQHRARLGIRVRRGERCTQHRVHLDRNRVLLVGAIEPDTRYSVAAFFPQITSDQGGNP